jgi:hypothetical protein
VRELSLPAEIRERIITAYQPIFKLVDRSVLGSYATEVSAIQDSPLVLSRPQQEERGRSIVVRALHELFGGDASRPYRRRLEEMAYVLHATGRAGESELRFRVGHGFTFAIAEGRPLAEGWSSRPCASWRSGFR